MLYGYVCSPYRGNIFKRIRNKRYARHLTKLMVDFETIPITPHLYLTEVLKDSNPEERKKGTGLSLELLKMCDVVLVGTKYGISEGMAAEIKLAEKIEIKILYILE